MTDSTAESRGYTRTGQEISVKRSYGVIKPPQSRDLSITEAVWDHLDKRTKQKAANIQRGALESPSRSLENYS